MMNLFPRPSTRSRSHSSTAAGPPFIDPPVSTGNNFTLRTSVTSLTDSASQGPKRHRRHRHLRRVRKPQSERDSVPHARRIHNFRAKHHPHRRELRELPVLALARLVEHCVEALARNTRRTAHGPRQTPRSSTAPRHRSSRTRRSRPRPRDCDPLSRARPSSVPFNFANLRFATTSDCMSSSGEVVSSTPISIQSLRKPIMDRLRQLLFLHEGFALAIHQSHVHAQVHTLGGVPKSPHQPTCNDRHTAHPSVTIVTRSLLLDWGNVLAGCPYSHITLAQPRAGASAPRHACPPCDGPRPQATAQTAQYPILAAPRAQK